MRVSQIAGYLATYYAHTHVKGWLSNYTKCVLTSKDST